MSFLKGNVIVFWSSDGIHQDSAGSLLDSSYIFDLGAFDDSFTPTVANIEEWSENWTSLGKVSFDPNVPHFSGNTVLTSNAAPFTTTADVYIWGYNLETPQAQWTLITNPAWSWPDTNNSFVIPSPYAVLSGQSGHVNVVGETNQNGVTITTAPVDGAAPPEATFEDWVSLNFSTADQADDSISGTTADPDEDGKSNFFEYAIGTNPTSPSADRSLGLEIVEVGADRLPRLTVSYNPQAAVDVTIQQSVNVGEDPFVTLIEQDSIEQSAGYEVVDHTVPVDASHSMDFYRLMIVPN